MLNVAIIGAGTISNNHAVGIEGNRDRVQCTAVADVNLQAATSLAERFSAKAYPDHVTMLKEEHLDIVAVCLPHGLHLAVGIDVLKSGADLFLEKPMALTSCECKALLDAANEHGKQIFVGQTHQYYRNFQVAKQMINEGAIGVVRMIYDEIWAYYGWEGRKPWFLDKQLAGGGPLFNTSPHQIDHLLYLVDSPITAVRSSVCSLRNESEIDSDWMAFVEYESGVRGYVGTYQGTKAEDGARLECRVFGTEGTISINPFAQEVVLCQKDGRNVIETTNDADPFVSEWKEFLDALEHKRAARTDGTYGARVVAVLEAITQSSQKGVEVAPVRF